jgi:hypothetical protein
MPYRPFFYVQAGRASHLSNGMPSFRSERTKGAGRFPDGSYPVRDGREYLKMASLTGGRTGTTGILAGQGFSQ